MSLPPIMAVVLCRTKIGFPQLPLWVSRDSHTQCDVTICDSSSISAHSEEVYFRHQQSNPFPSTPLPLYHHRSSHTRRHTRGHLSSRKFIPSFGCLPGNLKVPRRNGETTNTIRLTNKSRIDILRQHTPQNVGTQICSRNQIRRSKCISLN